jgi:uncharacterized protein YndB with AHSA1/START domain
MVAGRPIRWKLHLGSAPEFVFRQLTTDQGRARFWAEESKTIGDEIELTFGDGTRCRCKILSMETPAMFALSYFGSVVEFRLASDGADGTDLTMTNSGVPEAEWQEVHAGWLNVLFPLKAAVDHGIDLRNHDRGRTWGQGFVDG